jgi:protocatechuate 3,4-dioxygenase alpha subunit
MGPLYGYALMFEGSEQAVAPDSQGAVAIEGLILDGDNAPLAWPEGYIEFWEGEQWARGRTDETGRYRVVVRKPEPTPTGEGSVQAPHLNVAVFARGLLKQVLTRVYFPDELAANAVDPVLELVPEEDRELLVAVAEGDVLRFDIRLQGEHETPFFVF